MMKSILLIVLAGTTIASAAVLAPALPLDLVSNPTLASSSIISSLPQAPILNLSLPLSYLPDSRFKTKIAIGAPLLPVNPALMNILWFMSLVAAQEFTDQIRPRTYSTPTYRGVQITSYAWTEARFLLWGIFYAVNEMVASVRFHDVTVELYWEGKLVGKLKLAVKRAQSLAGGAANPTLDSGEDFAQSNVTGRDEGTTDTTPVDSNVTDSDLAPLTFSQSNASTTMAFAVSFESIAGASRVDRNDVFLTFYGALLHVAQFPPEMPMQDFHTGSPRGKLHLDMQEIGIGCQYGEVITALLYVPKYMMERSGFGYRETDFVVKLGGERACLGTLIKGLIPVERRENRRLADGITGGGGERRSDRLGG